MRGRGRGMFPLKKAPGDRKPVLRGILLTKNASDSERQKKKKKNSEVHIHILLSLLLNSRVH